MANQTDLIIIVLEQSTKKKKKPREQGSSEIMKRSSGKQLGGVNDQPQVSHSSQ